MTVPTQSTATLDQIAQQTRVINATRNHVQQLMIMLGQLDDDHQNYTWLGLSDDSILDDAAFEGTGTNRADYRAAVVSLEAIQQLLAEGHGTNLARFSI